MRRRIFQSLFRGLRRIGLDVTPLGTGAGRYFGMQVEWRKGDPNAIRGTIVDARTLDKPARFFVANDVDEIQRYHRRGEFYERQELGIIADHFRGGTFVDIGANVGNHALFALLHLGAERVVAFEPQPLASAILQINLLLNGLADRVTIHKAGLSDEPGTAGFVFMANNLGGTRLVTGAADGVPIMIGDEALATEKVDFIKIDTEGFEHKVLDGLRKTIATQRPTLFVEFDDKGVAPFEVFCHEMGYSVKARFSRYDDQVNLLAEPNDPAA